MNARLRQNEEHCGQHCRSGRKRRPDFPPCLALNPVRDPRSNASQRIRRNCLVAHLTKEVPDFLLGHFSSLPRSALSLVSAFETWLRTVPSLEPRMAATSAVERHSISRSTTAALSLTGSVAN